MARLCGVVRNGARNVLRFNSRFPADCRRNGTCPALVELLDVVALR